MGKLINIMAANSISKTHKVAISSFLYEKYDKNGAPHIKKYFENHYGNIKSETSPDLCGNLKAEKNKADSHILFYKTLPIKPVKSK